MFKCSSMNAIVLGLAAAALTAGALPVQAEPVIETGKRIVIVHTNDLHGNLEPDSKQRGGLTKIATIIKQIRKENPHEVIYLEAGDVAQGTPVSNVFRGEPMFKAIRLMDPVAGTLGNHEFDWGLDTMKSMVKTADYPILAANVLDEHGNTPFKPFRIVEVNGVKIGVIGLITDEIPSLVKKGNTGKYIFQDPSVAAAKYIPKMYAKGAELIVALTHNGVDEDKVLATKVPAIDVIVGGHSHTKLEQPINVGGHTWIVQADHYGRQLGVCEMMVSPYNGKIYSFSSKLIAVDGKNTAVADKEVQAIADKYNEKVRPLMEQEVGKTSAETTKTYAADQLDCSLGNMICDAIRVKSGADVAVYNYGGIRLESFPGGAIKRGDVFRLLPFDDIVVTLTLKGSDLIELMNQAAQLKIGPLQVSGITAVIDKTAHTVSDLKVNGKDVDPNAEYVIATTEFLSKGGDSFTALEKGTPKGCFEITRDVFVDYLNDQPVLTIPTTGRLLSK